MLQQNDIRIRTVDKYLAMVYNIINNRQPDRTVIL